MNRQMLEVMQRRGELVAKIAAQREQISELGTRWQLPLALVDQGLVAARCVRAHPVIVASAAALLVVRRRGILGLVKGAWSLWKVYRAVSAFSKRFQV